MDRIQRSVLLHDSLHLCHMVPWLLKKRCFFTIEVLDVEEQDLSDDELARRWDVRLSMILVSLHIRPNRVGHWKEHLGPADVLSEGRVGQPQRKVP